MVKFKTKQFESLDTFLQWLDDIEDRVIILNTVKTTVFVATYVEFATGPVKYLASPGNDRAAWNLLDTVD